MEADGHPGRTHDRWKRPDPAGSRRNTGDRAVGGVRHPDEALAVGHAGRAVADPDRFAYDLVDRRVDPRDGAVETVGDPDRAFADRDAGGSASDRDRLHEVVRGGIDA